MAIRYSGDVEVRLLHKGGTIFHVTVRTPKERLATDLNVGGRALRKVTPEDYDRVALVVLKTLDRKKTLPCERDTNNVVTIRRVFQAPCPVR